MNRNLNKAVKSATNKDFSEVEKHIVAEINTRIDNSDVVKNTNAQISQLNKLTNGEK